VIASCFFLFVAGGRGAGWASISVCQMVTTMIDHWRLLAILWNLGGRKGTKVLSKGTVVVGNTAPAAAARFRSPQVRTRPEANPKWFDRLFAELAVRRADSSDTGFRVFAWSGFGEFCRGEGGLEAEAVEI